MDKRNIQKFLMVSTAFFALNASARPSQDRSTEVVAQPVGITAPVAIAHQDKAGKP